MNGNAAPNGVNSTTGGYYGIFLFTTGITIRSFNEGVDLFGSSAQLDGIYIYDGSSKIWGKTNVNLTGIGLARSGIFTAANGTGGGIKSFDGDVFIKGISNTADRPGVYIEVPIEATVGSVTVSGAGKFNGIKFDTGYSGSIVAGAAVNLIGYSIDGDAIYMNKTGSPIISSGTGDITFSGYVESGASNMYGVYAATGVNISSTSGDVIFQASKIDGVSGTGRTRLVNAATAATPVYATADSANIAFGSSSGLSFAGNISVNTTDGYIKLGAKNPTITGVMGGFGLLLTGTGQTYSLSGNNTLSTIAADIDSGSLTYTTTSTMTVGTVSTTTGISAGSIALTAGGSGVVNTGGITINTTSSANTITGGLSGAGDFSTTTGNTLTLSNTSGTPDYTGIISGPVVITKSGAGTQKFSGASTYTGGTSVTNGTLQSGANTTAGPPPTSGPFGTGTITVNGGVLDLNGKNVGNALSITGTGLSTNGVIINSSATAGEVSGTVTMTAASSIGGTNPYTISGVISGGFALTKLGTNVVTLSGNNTYTGATSITAGTLVAANSGAVGTSAGGISITSGATLALQGGITIADAINTASGAGVGSLGAILNNSGSNTITGLVTLGAATTIGSTAGTLTFDVASSNALTGTYNLTFTGAGDITVADPIATSTGTLTKSGNGTLTLSANNTYTGATTISNGVVRTTNNTALGTVAGGVTVASGAALELSGGITIGDEALSLNGTGVSSGGALRNISENNTYGGAITLVTNAARINSDSGTLTLSKSTTAITATNINLTVGGSGNTTVSTIIATGSGTLTKDGSGTLTLSAANTYTGSTTINEGTLIVGAAAPSAANGALGNASSAILLGNTSGSSNASLITNGAFTIARAITVQSGNSGTITIGGTGANSSIFTGNITLNKAAIFTADTGGTATFSTGALSGTGALTKSGAGTVVLSGANTYSGGSTISAGILSISSDGNLGAVPGSVTASSINLNGGTLLATADITLNSNRGITLGASSTISVDTGDTLVYAGIITDGANSNGLTKAGAGTLKLVVANTYDGGTTLSAGTLGIYNNGSLGSGALTMAGSTTLMLGRAITDVTNNISLTGNATVAFDTNVEYLVVAGGGSGGVGRGGGGGAGGVLSSNTNLTDTSYSIAVGAGGAAVNNDQRGNSGSNSSLGTVATAVGGGGGGGWLACGGLTGGSGGGASGCGGTGGSGTVGQGSAGSTISGQQNSGGGGGGAGGAASDRNGGVGVESFITGSSLWVGGGGGAGAILNTGLVGTGGTGGGASGKNNLTTGNSGQTNTGGGGGGVEGYGGTSGAGGSGIVVVRYLGADASSGGTETTGTGTATGYTISTFTSSNTLTFNALGATLSGKITGANALTVNANSGSVTLTGANEHSGTAITAGTVKVGIDSAGTTSAITSGALGKTTATVSSGATLDLNGKTILNALTMSGAGIGNNGALINSSATPATASGAVTLAAASTIGGSGNYTIGGAISGAVALTKVGANTITLTGASNGSTTTTISDGTLQLGNGSTSGVLGSGNVSNNASLIFNRSDDVTVSNAISGSGSLQKSGAGVLTLGGANGYTGATTISAGTLKLGHVTALGTAAAGTTVASGAVLDLNGQKHQ
jgi:autotransporter-associated beta strand protein